MPATAAPAGTRAAPNPVVPPATKLATAECRGTPDRTISPQSGGMKIKAFLNADLAKVLERRADLVALLEDESILHIEFQSTNDKDMAYRAGIYCVLLGHRYRCRVRQVVLYAGLAKMRMPDGVDLGESKIAYRLIDIRSLSSEALIASGRPGDLALAMLAGGGPERLGEIIRRANELKGPERQRVLAQMVMLCGLRRLTGRLTMELKTMGTTINIAKNEILRDLVRDGQAKIIRIQIEGEIRQAAQVGGRTSRPRDVVRRRTMGV